MGRRRNQAESPLDRIAALLDEAPIGLHDLAPVDGTADLPVDLAEIYVVVGAGTLFHETVELFAPERLVRDERGLVFGTCDGDEVWLDDRGRVWRLDPERDIALVEGSSLDRWLWGVLDGYRLLFDHEGEFADEIFDEGGDLSEDTERRILAAQLRRDPRAVGLRLRRAALDEKQRPDLARAELEEVVHAAPELAEAWMALARISERKGELAGARDEATAGAEAAERTDHPHAGYFWSHVARLAAADDDEPTRASAAARVIALAPELRAAQLAGAAEQLELGDTDAAAGLCALLRAVWPRDLEVLDLGRRLATAATPSAPE